MISSQDAMQAKDVIFKFIQDTTVFLEGLVEKPYGKMGLLIMEDMQGPLKDAWHHFREDFQLNDAKARIEKTSNEGLQSHGLYGAQLSAKLYLIKRRLARFLNDGTKTALLWVLDAIDTLLDSVLKATGIDEALKEIKELLRNSING